jgi:tRNA pseudouridine55 synthase
MTSHDVVSRIRRTLKVKKVGHAGTLDPMATGVLVICLGSATRLSEYVMATTKRYRAEVRLGVTTNTYDADGDVAVETDPSDVTQADVEHLLPQFTGAIQQVPPMYSAIKKNGQKLYELARAGKTVEREPRAVTIDALTVADWSLPYFTLDIVCGSGTYIRSLAHDIGHKLGVGAHLTGLVRTASGSFSVDNAVPLNTVLETEDWRQYLLPPDRALMHFPAVYLDEDGTEDVSHGRAVEGAAASDTLARAYGSHGTLMAVLRSENGLWRPHKVLV